MHPQEWVKSELKINYNNVRVEMIIRIWDERTEEITSQTKNYPRACDAEPAINQFSFKANQRNNVIFTTEIGLKYQKYTNIANFLSSIRKIETAIDNFNLYCN